MESTASAIECTNLDLSFNSLTVLLTKRVFYIFISLDTSDEFLFNSRSL